MKVATSPPRKARKPSEIRDKLIAVAHGLVARRGFAGTRTDGIALSAGITRGALGCQFADKRDLFQSDCEVLVSRLARELWKETMEQAWRGEYALWIGFLRTLGDCVDPEVRQILLVDGPSRA